MLCSAARRVVEAIWLAAVCYWPDHGQAALCYVTVVYSTKWKRGANGNLPKLTAIVLINLTESSMPVSAADADGECSWWWKWADSVLLE